MAKVTVNDTSFVIVTEPWEGSRAKNMPDREWSKKDKVWYAPFTVPNAKYIRKEFALSETTSLAVKKADELVNKAKYEKDIPFPSWYSFKNKPRKHQVKALNRAWPKKEFAFFHEMRTGKTFTAINLACARAMDGQIEAMIVLCPTPIKTVWELQLEEHAPIPVYPHVLESGDRKVAEFIKSKPAGMKVLIVGIEALSQGGAYKIAQEFVIKHRCMAVVDESSRIKNQDSTRTKKAIDLGGMCQYRTILTGTPITQGMQDLYAQMAFLHWGIIGSKSYFSFRNRYCIMGGFEGREIIGYQNIGELLELVSPYVDVVQMKEVADLPPNIYQQRFITPTKEQVKAFNDLRDYKITTHDDGEELEVETVLERLTRYQQIAGGSFPFKENEGYSSKPIPGKNPKLEELKLLVPEINGKIIIWARFRPEIKMISDFLAQHFGEESVVQFHGGIDIHGRKDALVRFQREDDCRFFVSNPQTGGMGIKLSEASTVIYYSNDFSHENRVQSEARPHDADKKDSVLYIDLVLDHRVDKMIHEALKRKQSIADFVKEELRGGPTAVDTALGL